MKSFLIAIPSKGRPENCTGRFLTQYYDDLNFKFFVEPKDREKYLKILSFERIEVLPENDLGIGFARNAILNYCRKEQLSYVYMLDDDIKYISVKQGNNKWIRASWRTDLFEEGIQISEKNSFSLLGISHSFMTRFVKNSIQDVGNCTRFNLNKVEDVIEIGNYDSARYLFEDVDLNIRLRIAKCKVSCWFDYSFSLASPIRGKKIEGGCTKYYKENLQKELSKLCESFPQYVRIRNKTDRFGRLTCTTNWKRLRALQKNPVSSLV